MPNTQPSNKDYFEAKIQLRPKNKELLSYVRKQIKKYNIHVAKEIHKKYGPDLYVSSNKFAMQLGKKLNRVFPGKLTTSRKLFSRDRQTSKAIYRVTICFRLSN